MHGSSILLSNDYISFPSDQKGHHRGGVGSKKAAGMIDYIASA